MGVKGLGSQDLLIHSFGVGHITDSASNIRCKTFHWRVYVRVKTDLTISCYPKRKNLQQSASTVVL